MAVTRRGSARLRRRPRRRRTVAVKLMPPLSFFLKPMLGGLLLRRIPKPSSSCSISFLWPRGFSTSRTIRIRLQVRATAGGKRGVTLPVCSRYTDDFLHGSRRAQLHTFVEPTAKNNLNKRLSLEIRLKNIEQED